MSHRRLSNYLRNICFPSGRPTRQPSCIQSSLYREYGRRLRDPAVSFPNLAHVHRRGPVFYSTSPQLISSTPARARKMADDKRRPSKHHREKYVILARRNAERRNLRSYRFADWKLCGRRSERCIFTCNIFMQNKEKNIIYRSISYKTQRDVKIYLFFYWWCVCKYSKAFNIILILISFNILI